MFKNKSIKYLVLVVSGLIISFNAFSQPRTIKGVVTAYESIPVSDVPVQVKGSQEIAYTDTLGIFYIVCETGDKLIIDTNNFYKQKVKIKDDMQYLAVNLKSKSEGQPEIHNTGYSSYVSAKDNLNAITTMTDNDMDFSYYNDIYEIIAGRFPGVQIVNGEIIVRGQKSINSSNAALLVIDGHIASYSQLQTTPVHLIKSIDIIKDGAGTAVYGSQGANGVVVIETKTGEDLNN